MSDPVKAYYVIALDSAGYIHVLKQCASSEIAFDFLYNYQKAGGYVAYKVVKFELR